MIICVAALLGIKFPNVFTTMLSVDLKSNHLVWGRSAYFHAKYFLFHPGISSAS